MFKSAVEQGGHGKNDVGIEADLMLSPSKVPDGRHRLLFLSPPYPSAGRVGEGDGKGGGIPWMPG
jgi:hypothetical protein